MRFTPGVIEVETIAGVARTPGIYAMYGGERVGRGWVAYVGIATNLHRRLEQRVIRRDSSVVTRAQAVGVNIEHVRYIDWWVSPLVDDEDARHAAELIAFDVLNPALRVAGPTSPSGAHSGGGSAVRPAGSEAPQGAAGRSADLANAHRASRTTA